MPLDSWLEAVRTTARGGMLRGGKSPNKPLLLAAVLSRIAQGKLLRPEVRLDQATRALYRQIRAMAFPDWPYKDDSRQPFARLAPEVWTMRPAGTYEAELAALLGGGSGAPWQAIARATDCALLPAEVHAALAADPEARRRLASILLDQLGQSGADEVGLSRVAELLAPDLVFQVEPTVNEAEEDLLESAIEDRLVAAWDETPFAEQGVRLHTNARGEVVGQQYPVGSWSIDLLGWQESRRCWWVIELKRRRATDQVFGQVGRYVGWVDRYLTRGGEQSRGIIVAPVISPQLRHACYSNPRIEAWTFDRGLRVHPS